MFFKNDFGFFAFIMLVSSVTKSVKCFDILEDILASHKQIGICRIGCLSKLVPLRQDSMCFRHSSCKSCWELCQRFQLDKSDKALLCSQPGGSSSCDDGCQIACKFGQNKVTEQVETPFDLSTNFIGCTLFWKTNRDNHLVTINQLYGMDDQETWFDMGQTTESFFTLLPRQADRAMKIRLVVITEEYGVVAETEISLGQQRCNSLLPKEVPTFLNSSSSKPENNSTSSWAVTTAMLVITFLTISLIVIYVYLRRRSKFQPSIGNLPSETELNNQNPDNLKKQFSIASIDNLSFYA